MSQLTTISPAQYEVLNMLSCITREDDLAELKNVIVKFLNSRLQNEIYRLYETGELTDEKVAAWQHEHTRTPYKQM